MTAAACKAVYSDWKLIRTRSCVQIVFEIPVEQAGEAYDVLGGMPDPSKSVWCAIARLNAKEVMHNNDGESTEQPHKTPPRAVADNAPRGAKKSWHEMPMSQQAGIMSADPLFQQFVHEIWHWHEKSADVAADFIRNSCMVKSRADILPGTTHELLWKGLLDRFYAWRDGPVFGAA